MVFGGQYDFRLSLVFCLGSEKDINIIADMIVKSL